MFLLWGKYSFNTFMSFPHPTVQAMSSVSDTLLVDEPV